MVLCSIVLPTWNGAEHLARLLPALAAQELDGELEIVAIDSSSTDDSRELLTAAGADVEVIPKAEFRHGPTRNRAAARARGRFLVFLSQDAEPSDEHFVRHLVTPFDATDGAGPIAGVYARVLPRPDDDPLTRRTVLAAPEAGDEPVVRRLPEGVGLGALSSAERSAFLRFNNVASAIERATFERFPFPDVPFGEDFAWARNVLEAGLAIAFEPSAVAYHAHAYRARQAFRRYRTDAAFHRAAHEHRVRPTLVSALRGWLFEMRADARYLTHADDATLGSWLRSPLLRGAQVLGQYVGSRAHVEAAELQPADGNG